MLYFIQTVQYSQVFRFFTSLQDQDERGFGAALVVVHLLIRPSNDPTCVMSMRSSYCSKPVSAVIDLISRFTHSRLP